MPPPRQFRSPPETRYSLYGHLIRGTLPQGDVTLETVIDLQFGDHQLFTLCLFQITSSYASLVNMMSDI